MRNYQYSTSNILKYDKYNAVQKKNALDIYDLIYNLTLNIL